MIPRTSDGMASSPCALAHGFLDPREIDDALAHHGFRNLTELGRLGFGHVGLTRHGLLRHGQPNELLVQAILDAQQRRSDVENHLLALAAATLDDVLETLDFAVDVAT